MSEWRIDGASKDRQSITADWKRMPSRMIDGVAVHEIANVPKENGHLVEIFRPEWFGGSTDVAQVFQVVLNRGMISAWHAHESTVDRLFVAAGIARIVLYDAREESLTRGEINEFRFGVLRPALVLVPPRVWHGLQCISEEPAIVLNLVDRAYEYADPDHWRVPADSPAIPFRF
jgi:dTDP-4-dehydrorhamnose 3,5-epimerase